jgi:hypothetical protein
MWYREQPSDVTKNKPETQEVTFAVGSPTHYCVFMPIEKLVYASHFVSPNVNIIQEK